MNVLLHVVVVRYDGHPFGSEVAAAVRKAFRSDWESEKETPSFRPENIWNSVRIAEISHPDTFDSLELPPNSRVLWIVLPHLDMVRDAAWQSALSKITHWLDTTPSPEGQEPLLLYGSRETIEAMPDFQARDTAQLGEHRIAPHRLALLALHRARILLGREGAERQKLKLFISHAKVDGVFFADALRHAITQIPGLEPWYDAEDIPSGARWRKALRDNASSSILIAIRTEAYTSRPACLEEFHYALEAGVPIVVVDALLGAEIPPAPLPLSAVPTVRIQDGNTFRVLAAALREHVRILLVETRVSEQCAQKAPHLPATAWRIWPRLPGYHAIQEMMTRHIGPTPCCIVVADAAGPEINAAAGMLQRMRRSHDDSPELISLSTAELFGDYAVILANRFRSPTDPIS